MKDSFKGYKYTNKEITKISNNLRKSVVYVISGEPRYKHLAKDPIFIDRICASLVDSMYAKDSSGMFSFKSKESRSDMVSSIVSLVDKQTKIDEVKEAITYAKQSVGDVSKDYMFVTDCLYAKVCDAPEKVLEEDFDLFFNDLAEEANKLIYAGSEYKIPSHLKRDDLLFLDLILVAEGKNSNNDYFLAEELEKSYRTLVGMPLVEEHEVTSIKGVFFSSSVVRISPGKERGTVKLVASGGRVAIRAGAFVYKRRFPRESALLKSRFDQGLLRFSTEMGFKRYACGHCKKEFSGNDTMCDHLIMRNTVDDPSYTRVPLDMFFIGGAYTIQPAEPSAVALDVKDGASKSSKNAKACVNNVNENINSSTNSKENKTIGGDIMAKMYEFDSVEELLSSEAVQALVEAQAANLDKEEKEALVAAAEELSTERDSLKEATEKLQAQIDELTEKLSAAESKVAELESDKKVSDTLISLQHKGYKFDSDDAIVAFTERIKSLDEKNIQFIVELMAKQVNDTQTNEPNDQDSDDVATDVDSDSVTASKSADVNISGSSDTIKSIRDSWQERLNKLSNP
jgi:hypothetical protein